MENQEKATVSRKTALTAKGLRRYGRVGRARRFLGPPPARECAEGGMQGSAYAEA